MSIDKQLEQSVVNARKAFEYLEATAAGAVKALRAEFGTVQQLAPYPLSEAMNKTYVSTWSHEPLYDTEIAALEKAYQASLPVWEANKAIIAGHIELKAKLEAFLNSIGLPDGRVYTNPPKTRSRYRNPHDGYVKVGWRNSLEAIPTHDSWPGVVETYKRRLAVIAEAQQKKAREQEEAARKRKQEEAKLEAEVARRELAKNELGIPMDTPWYEVMGTILAKNKYLRLAHYLQKNRGDWSEGPDYASIGMNGFTVETALDRQIADCIQPHIDDWEGDGRVFRDCEWSYDRLFAMVAEQDPALHKQYSRACEIEERLEER